MVEAETSSTSAGDPGWVFAELGRIVLSDEPLGAALKRVAALAVEAIPEAAEASVTLMEESRTQEHRARTIAFTGSLAAALDERQYESGWGPCLEAAVSGDTVVVDTREPRSTAYPDFADAARRAGVVESVSVGLPLAEQVVGALNMYCRTSPVRESSVQLAEHFASYAAVAVANAARYASTADRAENLAAAMQSRAVIEQAKGIIMLSRHCNPDEAFAVLVRTSQHRNQKLRDVAVSLVLEATQPSEGR